MSVLDLFSLRGKTALITGGNHGIGYAIARAFVEAGAGVVITGRRRDALDEAAEALRNLGGDVRAADVRAADVRAADVRAAVGDVTVAAEAAATVDFTLQSFGRIDVLVNNAGHGSNVPSETMPLEHWDELIALNLTSVFRMSQLVAPGMLARGSGSIINLGSISGLVVNRPQWHAPYNAAKAGVHHLTRSLAAEWAARGVRVNAIAPGFVAAEGEENQDPAFRKYWVDEVPVRRFGRPEEIAPAALYLASDASTFTTGTVMLVDGGYTLW